MINSGRVSTSIIVIFLFMRVKYSESAYSQWISIHIENKANGHVLKVKNTVINWGKWYRTSKDDEIEAPTVVQLPMILKKLSIHVADRMQLPEQRAISIFMMKI